MMGQAIHCEQNGTQENGRHSRDAIGTVAEAASRFKFFSRGSG